jgi:hypothetical protein
MTDDRLQRSESRATADQECRRLRIVPRTETIAELAKRPFDAQ